MIGHGGMATVYRAVDRATGQVVALKKLHDHLQLDAAVRSRFFREVEITRTLSHPHIIRIFEVIEDPLSFVMEYGGDRDLKELIREQAPLEPAEIEAMAGQILSALSAAHQAGIIHRDIKPQNILVDGAGGLKLVDFGLARAQGMASLTTKTMIIGTPDYIAPEVIMDRHLDPRSDLYSLGIILFELATGVLPFTGNAPLQSIQRRLEAPAPDPQTLRPDLPLHLSAAIRKALERDPADRFQTAEEMARALADRAGGLVPAAAVSGEDHCPACQAVISSDYPVCLECGDETLAKVEPGSNMVLLTALHPEPQARDELQRFLSRLAAKPQAIARLKPTKNRPTLLVKNVTGLYAQYLVHKLQTLGHQAAVREMGEPSSDLLSSLEKAFFLIIFLGLYILIFTLAMGLGRMDVLTWLFGFAFGLTLMFGFEYWFSRNVYRLYPALIRKIARLAAPFSQGLMESLLKVVKGATSKKVKRDLQKVFRTSVALRRQLQGRASLADSISENPAPMLDSLFEMTLKLIAEINRIDADSGSWDEAGLGEQIQALARQAEKAADPENKRLLLSSLTDKQGLFESLLDHEKRRELLYARLLQVSARIELLLRSFLAVEAEALAREQADISVVLRRLSAEMEAVVRTSREMEPFRSGPP